MYSIGLFLGASNTRVAGMPATMFSAQELISSYLMLLLVRLRMFGRGALRRQIKFARGDHDVGTVQSPLREINRFARTPNQICNFTYSPVPHEVRIACGNAGRSRCD